MNTGPARQAAARARPAMIPRTRLRFWGVRGSIPTPGPGTIRYGGNTSCVEVRVEDQIIILDAGTGLRPLGQALAKERNRRPLNLTLLLTHTHWDHIQGLPFFAPVYQARNRLRILGYAGARQGLNHILSGQMENPFFPIGLSDVPANVRIEELEEPEFKLGKIRVRACLANHPGVCVGYRLFTPAGSIAFFPDNECRGQRGGSDPTDRSKHARNGAGSLLEFVRDADVLVMDAQYDRAEYRSHLGWGHGCLDDVVKLALHAGVKRLFLFHHDPNHDDAKVAQMAAHGRKLVAAVKGGRLEVEAAREGLTVELA